MPERDLHSEVLVLGERISNLTLQLNRFISHLESEQRVTHEISKRVDQLATEIEFLQKQIQESKNSSKWRLEIVIAIAALLLSAISNFAIFFR